MIPQVPKFKLNQKLFDGATEYERYTVIDSQYNGRLARMLYTDNETAAQSGLPFDNSPEMLFDYNERFMELVRGLKPAHLLVIGGGAFTLPMAIHKQFPGLYIDVFEIDGGLVTIAGKYFGFKETPHLKVHIGDGRSLLRRTDKTYDLIIVDVFNSTDVPGDFNQPGLAKEINNRLKSNGIIAMNIIAAYYGVRAEALKKLEKSFKKVFSSTQIFPAGSALSLWVSQNFILVAGENIKKVAEVLRYKPI